MSTPARFGRLARLYRWMEYASFGRWLERCRYLRLDEMRPAQQALVYGDGDGRFLARLACAAPQMTITAIDASARMLRKAERRLAGTKSGDARPGGRVSLHQADAIREAPPGATKYDLIVSHFFLDCFNDEEIAALLKNVAAVASDGAVWIISDFAVPKGRVSGAAGRIVIACLYLGFRLLTGLRTRRLPDYAPRMREAGWVREDGKQLLRGLLASERWRLDVRAAHNNSLGRMTREQREEDAGTPNGMTEAQKLLLATDAAPIRAGGIPATPPDVFPDPFPPLGPDPDEPDLPAPDPDPDPLDPGPRPLPVN